MSSDHRLYSSTIYAQTQPNRYRAVLSAPSTPRTSCLTTDEYAGSPVYRFDALVHENQVFFFVVVDVVVVFNTSLHTAVVHEIAELIWYMNL